jgi:hypothetical protein
LQIQNCASTLKLRSFTLIRQGLVSQLADFMQQKFNCEYEYLCIIKCSLHYEKSNDSSYSEKLFGVEMTLWFITVLKTNVWNSFDWYTIKQSNQINIMLKHIK